jgi:hypothetical protein
VGHSFSQVLLLLPFNSEPMYCRGGGGARLLRERSPEWVSHISTLWVPACSQAMEDFSVAYDNTVRGTGNSLLQFKFGDDGLDPSFMEDNGQPVDFDRLVMTIKVLTGDAENGGGVLFGVRVTLCSVLLLSDASFAVAVFLPLYCAMLNVLLCSPSSRSRWRSACCPH